MDFETEAQQDEPRISAQEISEMEDEAFMQALEDSQPEVVQGNGGSPCDLFEYDIEGSINWGKSEAGAIRWEFCTSLPRFNPMYQKSES